MKNISLTEIAQKTNISERILSALENDEYQLIPGQFYLNNFIKSYLDAIDIDSESFFKTHGESIMNISQQTSNESIVYYNKIRYSRFKRKNVVMGITFLVIASILLTYLFMENRTRIFEVLKGGSKVIPETGMAYDLTSESFENDFSPVRIEITAQSNCWLQAYRSGQKILERILKPGETVNIQGYELLLNIGNPSTISISINGMEITRYQRQARPLRIRISPKNLKTFF